VMSYEKKEPEGPPAKVHNVIFVQRKGLGYHI